MNKRLRIVQASFNNPLMPWQVPAFRGAVARIAGFENDIYHNHRKYGNIYRYPLVQYKCVSKKPLLLYLDQGVDEAYHFFTSNDKPIELGGRTEELELDNLNLFNLNLQVWDQPFLYRIQHWLAFNGESYQAYKALLDPISKLEFLEKKLKANIISMAKGIGWEVEREIKVRLFPAPREQWVSFKGTKVYSITTDFYCNVSLPQYIGLGKGASTGYGMVRKIRKNERREEKWHGR